MSAIISLQMKREEDGQFSRSGDPDEIRCITKDYSNVELPPILLQPVYSSLVYIKADGRMENWSSAGTSFQGKYSRVMRIIMLPMYRLSSRTGTHRLL